MVYPAKQTLSVPDGQIGLSSPRTALPLVVGVSSGGSANTLYQYTDPQQAKSDLGHGPGLELTLAAIQATGGALFLKTASTTAGAASAVTKTAVGSSTGEITTSGEPRDAYLVTIEITVSGTLGAGRFRYTLDGGFSQSEEITIPSGGTYVLGPTGITLTFAAGAGPVFFEAGDSHTFTCTAPQYTTSDLSTAWTALLQQIGNRKIRRVGFSGRPASASAGATMAAAIATHMATLEGRNHFARAMMDVGADSASNVRSSFASFADTRVGLAFGQAHVITFNAYAGWTVPRISAAAVLSERMFGTDISENLGRKAAPLRGVVAIRDVVGGTWGHDEGVNPQFTEADKINTLRTYDGEEGFFATNGYLKSPSGSDFLYIDWGLTIDEICDTVYDAQQKWLLKKVRVLSDGTGRIDPRDAVRIENAVRAQLKARILDPLTVEGFPGHVSALAYAVDRENNLLSTRELRSAANAVPLPPVEGISTTVGFARSVA